MCVVKSRRIRLVGHVARMADRSGPHRMLVGKPEGKRQLVRSKYVWEGNIETNLQEVIWGDMDCINLAQDMESW